MNYSKLLWAVVGAAVVGVQAGLSENGFSLSEQIAVGAAILAAIGTWLIPNTPALNTAKTWVNAVGIGVGLLATLAGDGLVGDDWLQALLLVLTTAGVYAVPNKTDRHAHYGPHVS